MQEEMVIILRITPMFSATRGRDLWPVVGDGRRRRGGFPVGGDKTSSREEGTLGALFGGVRRGGAGRREGGCQATVNAEGCRPYEATRQQADADAWPSE